MNEKQLRKLIDEGESVTLEFKSWIMCKNYNEIKDLAIKSAVALANARGGKCLLGVENDGSITGCPTTKTSQDLMDTIYNGTKPSLFIVDKTVSQIQAESRIQEYLAQKPSITSATVQQLCGYNKDQAYRILSKMCSDEILIKKGKGRGTIYYLQKNN